MNTIERKRIVSLLDRRNDMVRLFNVLANAKRLHIISLILNREMGVGEIAEAVRVSQSAISQHLGKLRAAGIVNFRREAQHIYYSISAENARRVGPVLAAFGNADVGCRSRGVVIEDYHPADNDRNQFELGTER